MEKLPLPGRVVHPLGYPQVADLPEERQKGLRAFWLDGLFASMASGFANPYYTLYLLSLSATNAQIGLVNTLNQLVGAAMAMPGATTADRTGRYRQFTVWTGLFTRTMWLVMMIAPWIAGGHTVIWIVILSWVAISGVTALGNAAWTALSADLVPVRLRGGYFSSRNIIMQFVLLLAIPIAGQLVDFIGEPGGYQFNLALAFGIAMISLYFYSRLPEHHIIKQETVSLSTREVLSNLRRMETFIRFTLGHAVLMLGVMFGAPFINVYMADELNFDVGTISLVTTVGVLASLVGMRVMGRLHDRFGITWTMRFGLGVPLITVAWLWVQHPWQAYLVNAGAALTWAGYNLGAFNLLLASTPNEHRPRYVAVNTTIISVVGAIGPLMGGWLLDVVGFVPVFSFSSIMRALGLILFFALVREPEPPPEPDEETA